jgi:hypothetical protein
MAHVATDGSQLARRFHRFFRRLALQARNDLLRLPQHPNRSIHNLRVRMKKLGAVLRLTKARMGGEEYEKVLAESKRLKNAFARHRDARVAAKLSQKSGGGKKPRVPMPSKAGQPLFIEVAILERLLNDTSFANLKPKDVLKAYVKCYRTGRKRMKKCLKNPVPELLHDWRGPVKRFFYQSLLLRHAKGARSRIDRARKLGKWLGKDHDWHLMAEMARKEQQMRTAEAFEEKRQSRQKRIFKLAAKLYEAPPSELRKKLEKDLA